MRTSTAKKRTRSHFRTFAILKLAVLTRGISYCVVRFVFVVLFFFSLLPNIRLGIDVALCYLVHKEHVPCLRLLFIASGNHARNMSDAGKTTIRFVGIISNSSDLWHRTEIRSNYGISHDRYLQYIHAFI